MHPEADRGSESFPHPWVDVTEALKRLRRADQGPRRKFFILGAGISGLAAAFELQRLGHTVVIYEGSDRVGGRIYTHRFKNGTYAERGAMRIPVAHDYSRHYIAQAGIPSTDLLPFSNANPRQKDFMDIGGKVVRTSQFEKEILPLFPDLNVREKAAASAHGPGGVLNLHMAELFSELENRQLRWALVNGEFSIGRLRELDSCTWKEYLSRKASADGLELMGRCLTIKANWDWSLATILRNELNQPGTFLYSVRGGMSRLIDGLKEKLAPRTIFCGRKVIDIELGRSGHNRIVFEGGDEQTFDQLLCTLPFPVMRDMPLRSFSQSKREAIHGMRYMSASKVYLSYAEPWWEKEFGIRGGGRSVSDRPDEKVWLPREAYYPNGTNAVPTADAWEQDGVTNEEAGRFNLYVGSRINPDWLESPPVAEDSDGQSARRLNAKASSMLASYAFDDGARNLCALPHDERLKRVVDSLRPMHGDTVADFEEGDAWCWDEHPWSKGALCLTPPKDLSTHLDSAKRPEGGVYFSGEHVSIAPGWIQGSLESTLRELTSMLKSS